MKLRPIQIVGLVVTLVAGARLVLLLTAPKPQPFPLSSLPPPPRYEPPPLTMPVVPPAPVMREELNAPAEKASAPDTPSEAQAPAEPAPPPAPPPPPFRASKPGADQFQPLKFPPDVTEPYTPEGFKKNLERALKECPMGAMEVISIDCEEFPCMALTELKDEQARQANLNACPAWHESYTTATQYVSSVQKRGGQEVHYMSWVPLPPHPADAKLVMLRSHRRAKAQVKALPPP